MPSATLWGGLNRTAHLAERRQMMQAWADYLDVLKKNERRSYKGAVLDCHPVRSAFAAVADENIITARNHFPDSPPFVQHGTVRCCYLTASAGLIEIRFIIKTGSVGLSVCQYRQSVTVRYQLSQFMLILLTSQWLLSFSSFDLSL